MYAVLNNQLSVVRELLKDEEFLKTKTAVMVPAL
jgi:hypothetical protein